MKKKMLFILTVALLVLTTVSIAHATTIVPAPGETLEAAITATQTSGPNCCKTGNFLASFTLGTMIPSTSDWTVTNFSIVSGGIDTSSTNCFFGQTPCSSLIWSLTAGFFFDGANDTLDGQASTPFTGSGGDPRKVTLFFVDGADTNLQYHNDNLLDSSKDKPGVFSYSVSAVPEPSSLLLFSSGALGLLGVIRRKLRA